MRQQVVDAALAAPEHSPRELAWQLTDRTGHFLSESSVYRILKAHDLITSPAFVVITAADRFPHPTTRPNELWQTDFTYLRVVGWGWYYLSTVLDDYSRYIVAWTLTTSMAAADVATTLDLARAKAGVDRVATSRPGAEGEAAYFALTPFKTILPPGTNATVVHPTTAPLTKTSLVTSVQPPAKNGTSETPRQPPPAIAKVSVSFAPAIWITPLAGEQPAKIAAPLPMVGTPASKSSV